MRRQGQRYPVKGQVSSQFSPGEISSIIIAWLVLSIAITYQNLVGLFTGIGSLEVVIAGFVATATGPGINLAFALAFLSLFLVAPSGFLGTVAFFGFELNVGLGSFNMIPIPPLDGSKIFRKNLLVGLGIALPLWAMFFILFTIGI